MSADDKYSVLNRDNLTQPVQMQLSQKQKYFPEVFLKVWNLVKVLTFSK